MSGKSYFNNYDLSFDKKKKSFGITNFLGVDYNPSQLQVASNHAVDMKNIIYKDRVNQKRNGYEELFKIEPVSYYVENDNGTYTQKTNGNTLNGIYNFIGGDGNNHTIAHIGSLLFEVVGLGKDNSFLNIQFSPLLKNVVVGGTTYRVGIELEDYKSMAFNGKNRLYILGGNKYFVLKAENGAFNLSEVEDNEETYIPITTIGITYADSPVSESMALDDINMLTQWRKNKLVSGTYIDDGVSLRTTRFWDYTLDSSVNPKNPKDINNISIKISSLKGIE